MKEFLTQSLLFAVAAVAVAIAVWFAFPEQEAPEEGNPVATIPSPTASSMALPDAPTNVPLTVDPVLLDLRKAYESPSTPALRIRLQGKVDEMWGGEPHVIPVLPVEMLLGQVNDALAPRDYRVFLAKLIRNAAKRSTDSSFRDSIVSGLRMAVRSETGLAGVRAELALALIDADPGPESVAVIAPLLEMGSDADARIAASALARSACSESKEALLQFVRRHAENPNDRPLTLGTALLPLCHEANLAMEPFLASLLRHTDDEVLLGAVLQGVGARPGSQQLAAALVSVSDRKLSSASSGSPFSRQLRRALRKQKAAMDTHPGRFDKATTAQIQSLLDQTS